MEEYPDNLLRGITRTDYITPEGEISAAAFYFIPNQENTRNGWINQSICWEDDDSVIDVMLEQKKEHSIQFKAGIARLPRTSIGDINRLPRSLNRLSYERDVLDGNPYHGNLLLKEDTPKKTRIQISNAIALCAKYIPRND